MDENSGDVRGVDCVDDIGDIDICKGVATEDGEDEVMGDAGDEGEGEGLMPVSF